MTLTEWLLAQIAEDEANVEGIWQGEGDPEFFWGPDRIRAECKAKRQLVEECRDLINSFGDWDAEPNAVVMWRGVSRRERSQAWGRLHTLALPYADRPGYREAWRP